MKDPITVSIQVNVDPARAYTAWTNPDDITKWAFASEDWEAPRATNDVRVGGRFSTLMAAKDKSAEFEFGGVYTLVEPECQLEYTMDGEDVRKVRVIFEAIDGGTKITESFEPEHQNTREKQAEGWQSIIENFKKHVEK